MLVMLVVWAVVGTVVIGRLADLQWFGAKAYADRGEKQLVHSVTLPAERGSIFDRTGQDLAISVDQPTIWANPALVVDPRGEAGQLAPVLSLDAADLQNRLSRPAQFVYLARLVDDTVAAKVKDLKLPGVAVLQEPRRFLPAGDLAGPLLGKVGTDGNGLTGLEHQFDKTLAGKAGRLVSERDPSGRELPGSVQQYAPSAHGDDLVLTVDRSIQYETERDLAAGILSAHALGGIALVMDTRSGELLAVACLRATDPAKAVAAPTGPGAAAPATAACDKDEALTNVYEPGSVQKLITISGALDQGVVKAGDSLTVPDQLKVADHVFHDAEPHPTSRWSVTDVVANSSNIGTIELAAKLGKQQLYQYQRAFGFGSVTGLGDPGESAGLLLDPARYSGTSMGSIPIGQGIAVTAVQMLAAYNTVANGGVYVAPKLVKAVVGADGIPHATPPSATHRVVSAGTATDMTAMLGEVVRVGTGQAAAIAGYHVAGKTGTARKPNPNGAGYLDGAYMSSFAGFVPMEQPTLTAMVVLDQPTPIFGGKVSAPLFSQMAAYSLRQLRVPPPAPGDRLATAAPGATAAGAKGVGDVGDASTASTPPSPARTPAPSGPSPPTTAPGPRPVPNAPPGPAAGSASTTTAPKRQGGPATTSTLAGRSRPVP